jgi:hypothetical protein
VEKARQHSPLSGLRAAALGVVLAVLGQGVAAQLPALPSGLDVSLLSAATDPDVGGLRIRFLAPAIGGAGFDLERLGEDMDLLCRHLVQHAEGGEPVPDGALIIVSISDRDVPVGVPDPEAVQVFQSYEHVEGDCIWSHF